MCNIWKNPSSADEMDLRKIEEVFSNPLFRNVEEMVLHGGEPTLREDIKDIYGIVIRCCPKLKKITTSTNGLKPALVRKRVQEILSVANPDAVRLTFTVSIDGLKEAHEKIRGIPGGFDRTMETLEVLKKIQDEYPIDLQIITVIQPQNLSDLEEMEKLARDHGVGITFQPLMIDTFYHNSSTDPRLKFSKEQVRAYRTFVEKKLIQETDTRSLFWRNYLDMMNGGRRLVPCAYDRYVLSLYPTGEVLPCAKEEWILFGNVYEKPVDEIWFGKESRKIRKRMREESCPTCSFYCGAEYSLSKEFFTYFYYRLKKAVPSVLRFRQHRSETDGKE
jgi:MoaA/NifB/PqqE/SkfB family radical SAM enzyme